jgi:hypothetical protein
MEMRRKSVSGFSFEGMLLAAYWAFAGYGLRALRPFIALLGLLVTSAFLVTLFGFHGAAETTYVAAHKSAGVADRYSVIYSEGARPDWREAVLFTFDASTSLIHSSGSYGLTLPGGFIEVIDRILGPTFLGLALLSLRNRLKR